MTEAKAIKISINALGGQGGGVLANWIVKLGERAGYIAQTTSVPGVAQRTGATVYYIELFSEAAAAAKGMEPVLALMPTPGDVDVVIASELMEAGRAILRGFVTEKTTLIASSHRVYAIGEKISLGDGRNKDQEIINAAGSAAGRLILADMEAAANASSTVISAVLFGALAGSGALPISRDMFESTIRDSKRAVTKNLAGFELGFAAATAVITNVAIAAERAEKPEVENATLPLVECHLRERMSAFPATAQPVIKQGLKKTVDFQDLKYGALYLDRLEEIYALDQQTGGDRRKWALLKGTAKHLALWMSYDDVVRVADLKTRASRFRRFRDDVRVAENQIVHVSEFMHPRPEEICDLLPPTLAKKILKTESLRGPLQRFLGEGRRVSTTKLRGFLSLYLMARMRFLRRGSYRYKVEDERINTWLALIKISAVTDYALACEIAALQRLIKGYGDTHERGLGNYARIVDALGDVRRQPEPAAALNALREAAVKDEEGAALNVALAAITPSEGRTA